MPALATLRTALALPFDPVGWEASRIARADRHAADRLGLDRRGGRDRREYARLVWEHAERRVAARRAELS